VLQFLAGKALRTCLGPGPCPTLDAHLGKRTIPEGIPNLTTTYMCPGVSRCFVLTHETVDWTVDGSPGRWTRLQRLPFLASGTQLREIPIEKPLPQFFAGHVAAGYQRLG